MVRIARLWLPSAAGARLMQNENNPRPGQGGGKLTESLDQGLDAVLYKSCGAGDPRPIKLQTETGVMEISIDVAQSWQAQIAEQLAGNGVMK